MQTVFEPTSDEFTVKAVSKPEEIKTLLAAGFEYVTDMDGYKLFRKRK